MDNLCGWTDPVCGKQQQIDNAKNLSEEEKILDKTKIQCYYIYISCASGGIGRLARFRF